MRESGPHVLPWRLPGALIHQQSLNTQYLTTSHISCQHRATISRIILLLVSQYNNDSSLRDWACSRIGYKDFERISHKKLLFLDGLLSLIRIQDPSLPPPAEFQLINFARSSLSSPLFPPALVPVPSTWRFQLHDNPLLTRALTSPGNPSSSRRSLQCFVFLSSGTVQP